MKPLILDCHAQLPLWRRLGQGAVNALGWAWWVYMWLPLLGLLLQYVAFKGVNHVLRDDPTDNVANLIKPGPLSPQLTAALDQFVTR